MAEFLNLDYLKGFDKDQIPRWQMVPFREYRCVQLLNGASLQVDGGPIMVTELFQDRPGSWELDPRLRGSHARYFRICPWNYIGKVRIKATDPSPTGRTRALLEVSAKDKKTVRINFLFVRDTAGHQTRRVPAGVPIWLSRINEIFRSQANIEVISDRVGWVTVNRDLGSVIRRTPGNE